MTNTGLDKLAEIKQAFDVLKAEGQPIDPEFEKKLDAMITRHGVEPVTDEVPSWPMRASVDSDTVARLVEETGFATAYCKLLAARGLTSEELIRSYFRPDMGQLRDPMLLDGMEQLVDELEKLYRGDRKIAIHGDYDVDGLTSTALLARALSSMGYDVKTYVPHRTRDGYGVSVDALRDFARTGYKTVMTCDTGASAVDEITIGVNELGLNILVTDHHPAKGDVPCTVMVNPNKPGDTYPFKGLCGAGVAFKVLQALCQRLGFNEEEFIYPYLDLVAMGTVCDVVPMVDENRVLVRLGLARGKKTQNIGLKEMLDNLGIPATEISETRIGWDLGPRFNAAGRVSEPSIGLELLLADDRVEARRLVEVMEECNTRRRALALVAETSAMIQAQARVAAFPDRKVLVLTHGADEEPWHQGVLSTVAPRIAGRFNRAVLLFSRDPATGVVRGSGRIVKGSGVRLNEAVAAASEYFLHHGGHAQACGVTVKEEYVTKLGDVERAIDTAVRGQENDELDARRGIQIDTDLKLGEIDDTTIKILAQCAPFGPLNEAPIFRDGNVELVSASVIGKNATGLKLRVRSGGAEKELISWDKTEEWDAVLAAVPGTRLDLAYQFKTRLGKGHELHIAGVKVYGQKITSTTGNVGSERSGDSTVESSKQKTRSI